MDAQQTPPLSPEPAPGRDLVVVGASMGGVEALARLASALPADLPAAVLAVVHGSAASGGFLAELLERAGPLPVRRAEDGTELAPGTITVAVPDRHLVVEGSRVRVTRGPRENHWRPAVDTLFRSAAVARGSRVIGVVLSGLLDDGAAGLAAVKACGGLAVVQDPDDAASPEMPASALRAVDADHVVPLAAIGGLLDELTRQPAPPSPEVPELLRREVELVGSLGRGMDRTRDLGEPTPYSCPDCGGGLWRMAESPLRFRCHLGHGFTARSLDSALADRAEEALGVALRVLEERMHLVERMGRREREAGRRLSAEIFERRAGELRPHAETLRGLLVGGGAEAREEMPADPEPPEEA